MSCGTIGCIPLLVPLIGTYLASSVLNSWFPFDIPYAAQFVTVVLILIATYIVAKIKCWKSTKSIFGCSFVPTLVFIVWLGLFFFPLSSPIMNIFGNNVFVIVSLSLLYKIIYYSVFDSC